MDELLYPDKKIPTKGPHCNEKITIVGNRKSHTSLPITLYKYVPLESAEKILSEGSIKLMRPIEANDTFEFMPAFEGSTNNKLLAIDAVKNSRILVSSFSRSCHIPTMWGHYADKSTGICLGFKTQLILNFRIGDELTANNNKLKGVPILISSSDNNIIFYPVLYMKERLKPSDNPDSYINSFLPACVKSFSWEYEHEFRLILKENEATYVQNGQYFYKPILSLLDCIILGPNCKVSVNYMKKFLETKRTKSITQTVTVHQAEYHPNLFRIITPGYDDTLEDSNGEYKDEIPAILTVGSSFSRDDLKGVQVGETVIYKNE